MMYNIKYMFIALLMPFLQVLPVAAVEFPELIDAAVLSGVTTVQYSGAAEENFAGQAVAKGDIDGDGTEDLIVGAYKANGGRGYTYVLFGSGAVFSQEADTLDVVQPSVLISGEGVLDWSGYSVATGDMNNDGYDDIIIGAYRNDPNGRVNAGEVYVVHGSATFRNRGEIALSTSQSGVVRISGDDTEDNAGYSVASGDVNGDNYSDVIIGAYRADPLNRIDAGEVYVVFGASNFSSRGTIDLSTQVSSVLRIYGESQNDWFGKTLASGDLDNDSDDEIIIGAPDAGDNLGKVYVIQGNASHISTSTIDIAEAIAGKTVISGGAAGDHVGDGLAVGNLNGDNFSDLIMNVPRAGVDGGFSGGKAVVLFGYGTFGDTGDASILSYPQTMFSVFYWETPDEGLQSVGAGDVNGDGFDELLIGIPKSSPLWRTEAGKAMIVYGAADIHTKGYINSKIDTDEYSVLYGKLSGDHYGTAIGSLDYNGDGIDDFILGAANAPNGILNNAGSVAVVKGYDTTEILQKNPGDGLYSSRNTLISGTFNTDMTSYDVTVTEDGIGVVPDSLTKNLHSFIFDAGRLYDAGSDISVSITGENSSGDAVAEGWSFHIKEDEAAPEIRSHIPGNNATNVHPDSTIQIIFTGDVEPDSTTVTVEGSAAGILATTKTWSDSILHVEPNVSFVLGDSIDVTVDAGDEYGDRNDPVSWTFYIRPEITPPVFTLDIDGTSAGYIPEDASIRLIYPGDVDKSTVVATLEGNVTGTIPGVWSWADTTYSFVPSQNYLPGETLMLVANASDIHQNATGDSIMTFLVKPDTTPPAVIGHSPADNEKNVMATSPITIEFSQDIHPDSTYFAVVSARLDTIAVVETWVDYSVTLTHAEAFAYNDTITVTVNAGDEYANRATTTWVFETRSDDMPPYFTILSPLHSSFVGTEENIVLAFPPDLDKQSVDISLVGNISGNVPGIWTWSDTLYNFDHSTPFINGDTLTLTVSASDIYQNSYQDSTVTMYVKPDDDPPSILTRIPSLNAANVALGDSIIITFSADVAPDSTNVTIHSAKRGAIAASKNWQGNTVTLKHATAFALSDTVTVTVSACDAYTNRTTYSWYFTTRPDTTPPYVTVMVPGNPQLMNSQDPISFIFPGDINTSSVNISIIDQISDPIPGSWNWADSIYVFNPIPPYESGSSITCTVNASDIYGNSLTQSVHHFSVKPEETPPQVLSHIPSAYAVNVAVDQTIEIRFNADIDPDSTSVWLTSNVRSSIPIATSWTDTTLTVSPTQNLQTDESVTVMVNASDQYGNRIYYSWIFGTGASVISSYYQVITSTPDNTISQNAPISILFSNQIDLDTATATFRGTISGLLSGSITWEGQTMTFSPANFMVPGESIAIEVACRDQSGAVIPTTTHTLTVGQHTPWVVISDVLPPEIPGESYLIQYYVGDPDGSYTVTQNWEYRIGTGAWKTIPATDIGRNQSRPPGLFNIDWSPDAALKGTYTEEMYIRMEVYDGLFASSVISSGPFTFDWNDTPSVAVKSVVPDYENNLIRIQYAINDAEHDSVSLAYEYSYDYGLHWHAGSPHVSLDKIPYQLYAGTFNWDYQEGLQAGIDYFGFQARLIPFDYKTGVAGVSDTIQVDLNAPPAISMDDIYTPQNGDVSIKYHLSDPESDTLSLTCYYSTDAGNHWIETAYTSDTASITAYNGTLTWYSKNDLPSIESFNIWFKIEPWDSDQGTSDTIGPFQLFNNSPPSITISVPDTASNVILIPYTISDLEYDDVDLHAIWRETSGEWHPVTALSSMTDISQDAYSDTLKWDSRVNTGEVFLPEVELRLYVTDDDNSIGDSSTTSITDTLAIDNLPPNFLSVCGYANADTIYIEYSEPVLSNAAMPESYSLSGNFNVKTVIANSNKRLYSLILEEKLQAATVTTISAQNITDLFGNTADTITTTFGATDDNANPRIVLDDVIQEVSEDVSIGYHITDDEGDIVHLQVQYSADNGVIWQAATIAGNISNIGPAQYNGSFIWESSTDLNTIDAENVMLRAAAIDTQAGEYDTTGPFHLDNNKVPSVHVTIDDTDNVHSAVVALSYVIEDAENDDVSMDILYSVDNGNEFKTASIAGVPATISPNEYSGTCNWNTAVDLPNSFAKVLLLTVASDVDAGIADSLWTWIDNYGACRAAVNMPSDEQINDVTIGYDLIDPYNRPIVLRAEYSVDNGVIWNNATLDGTIHVDPGDYSGTILWRSSSDLSGYEGVVAFRLIPDNGLEGIYGEGDVYVDYNIPPEVVISELPEELSGDVEFHCTISDDEYDYVTMEMEISIDGGNTWYDATIQDQNDEIQTECTIVWMSKTDMPNKETQNLSVRISATDADQGPWSTIGPLHLDNNDPPAITLEISDPDSVYNDKIDITHHIYDAENNMVSLTAMYSINNGLVYNPATITGNTSGIFSSGYNGSITWELEEDILSGAGTAILKIIPSDDDAGIADSVSVSFNAYGTCSVAVEDINDEQDALVPVDYKITDTKGNQINLTVEYSINKFGIWQEATTSGSLIGIGPEDYDGTFNWYAHKDINGFQGIAKLRITPYNGMNGLPAEIQIPVDYNEPPYLTDIIADTTSVFTGDTIIGLLGVDPEDDDLSVKLTYSTDNGATYKPGTISGGTGIRSGSQGVLTWHAFTDLGACWQKDVLLSFVPYDEDDGVAFPFGPVVVTNLAGDYNSDHRIDGSDLPYFVDAWNTQALDKELGPVTGSPPELTIMPDGAFNFEDLAVFVWMWNWYTTQEMGKTVIDPNIYQKSLSKIANSNDFVSIETYQNGSMILNANRSLDYFRIIGIGENINMQFVANNQQGDNQLLSFSRPYVDSFELAGVYVNAGSDVFSPPVIVVDDVEDTVQLYYSWRFYGDTEVYTSYKSISADELIATPTSFVLGNNAPNPFNPETTISFSLPVEAHVKLTVFNALGQVVDILCDDILQPGSYARRWNASSMPTGLYFYRLDTGTFTDTKKMLLMK